MAFQPASDTARRRTIDHFVHLGSQCQRIAIEIHPRFVEQFRDVAAMMRMPACLANSQDDIEAQCCFMEKKFEMFKEMQATLKCRASAAATHKRSTDSPDSGPSSPELQPAFKKIDTKNSQQKGGSHSQEHATRKRRLAVMRPLPTNDAPFVDAHFKKAAMESLQVGRNNRKKQVLSVLTIESPTRQHS